MIKQKLLLLLVSFLWGIAFIFQREGMQSMGPITFVAHRFLIAALVLGAYLIFIKKIQFHSADAKEGLQGGAIAGLVLLIGSVFQQISIQYTPLANVGFITGLYVIIVPLIGFFLAHTYSRFAWLGGVIACGGLYFLSGFEGRFSNLGDLLALIGAVFWALHIIVLGYWAKKANAFIIAFMQFLVCGSVSLVAAFIFEDNIFAIDAYGLFNLLICGVIITVFAYSLQIIGQAQVAPFEAAIIFSLEAVFAALAGYLVYYEVLTLIEIFGCFLIFTGCLLAQYTKPNKNSAK